MAQDGKWFIDDQDIQWDGQTYTARARVAALRAEGVTVLGSAGAPVDRDASGRPTSRRPQLRELTEAELVTLRGPGATLGLAQAPEPTPPVRRGRRRALGVLVGVLAVIGLAITLGLVHQSTRPGAAPAGTRAVASAASTIPAAEPTDAQSADDTTEDGSAGADPGPGQDTDAAHARFARHLGEHGVIVDDSVANVGQFADVVCSGLDNGVSADDLAAALVGDRITEQGATTVVEYAVRDVCPQHLDALQ